MKTHNSGQFMVSDYGEFKLHDHCHINSNQNGDRFVGIIADSDNVAIHFPLGYELPTSEDELRSDIKNLLRILALFAEKKDRVLETERLTINQSVDFPIHAYLYVINYYLDHNGSYYTETEIRYGIDNRGIPNWAKTIKTQTPMVQENSPIYLKQVVRESSPNLNKLITKIHKYCVAESFERIGWLFATNTPESADIAFDKPLFISILNTKLHNTNNDIDKLLFRSMISMIEFVANKTDNKQIYFGTDKFEIVWEKLIDSYFGERNKQDYFPRGLWTEKKYGVNIGRKVSALEPDSIMLYKDNYYVLDAKYYRYGVFPESGTNALPQSSDINKQITYGKFVKNEKSNGNDVFNAFIMPFNKRNNEFSITNNYGNIAEATGDWLDDPVNPKSYERIQGIVIDTRYLLKHYDGNHDRDKEMLSTEIKNGLNQ